MERNDFIAMTAARFLGTKFGTGDKQHTINSVELASTLADELEKKKCAPWPVKPKANGETADEKVI